MTRPTYAPKGITRPRAKGPHPGVHMKKGRPVTSKYRQIFLKVDAGRYREWLRASAAIEYGDLRRWLIFLADREALASINPS